VRALARRRGRLVTLGGPLLLVGLACDDAERGQPRERARPAEASEFSCQGGRCVQRHARLPDDGEWRCAEREGVAWCAGGEPPAGVVHAPAERGFLCGTRHVQQGGRAERVCVDESPDYPDGGRGRFRCRFVHDRGIQRECVEGAAELRPVASRALPDCWLDADCGTASCDRGRCARGAP
jgi:hypothetical protein